MTFEINIGIAEDHDLVRQGFIMLLNKYCPDIKLLFEASDGRELLKSLKQHKPDIILLDIEMPVIGGIKLIETVKLKYPKIKIIVISAHKEITSIIEYVKRGADSFLPKNCNIKELILTINKVQEHGKYYDENLIKELTKNGIELPGTKKEKKLTERDIKFIRCLEEKMTNDKIAEIMGIKTEAITKYRRRLLLKTNSNKITDLISYVKSHGYL